MILLLAACTLAPSLGKPVAAEDGVPDAGCGTWADADGDGFGDPAVPSCAADAVADATDCDDADAFTHPGAAELCDGRDNACGAWDPSAEDGLVTHFPPDGAPVDHSAAWAEGYGRVPVALDLDPGTWAVCPGDWYVNLEATGAVRLVGPHGSAVTTLHGVANRILSAPTDTEVVGLGFDWGSADEGDGGAILHRGGDLLVTDAWFRDCSGVHGGALAIVHEPGDLGNVTLSDVSFLRGYAEAGGAVYASMDGALRLDRALFTENTATGDGGALHLHAGSVGMAEVEVVGNDAAGDGGGLWVAGVVLAEDGVVVQENTAVAGGGLWLDAGAWRCTGATTSDAGFLANLAENGGGVALGAGDGVSFVAETCDFGVDGADNVATVAGADLWLAATGAAYGLGDDVSLTCDAQACE